MFLNPLWSVLLLCFPVAVYCLIIRPRLKAKLGAIYKGRFFALLYAFRTFVIAVFTTIITALPDILVQIAPIDFSPFLPQPWPMYTSIFFTVTVTLMKASETKPGER